MKAAGFNGSCRIQWELQDLPFIVQRDGFRVVGHEHIMGSLEGSEDQSVDRVFLDVLWKQKGRK